MGLIVNWNGVFWNFIYFQSYWKNQEASWSKLEGDIRDKKVFYNFIRYFIKHSDKIPLLTPYIVDRNVAIFLP